ncbi:MAG: xanthine dehydrogenase family protein molybdopterin-binding subunit [Gemmatimonadales bacterium]
MTATMRGVSRRDFIKIGAAVGGGLLVTVYGCGPSGGAGGDGPATYEANAFVRIGADGKVTVLSKHLEMGQGSYTGLATLVAEELDADWSTVEVIGAPADVEKYKNLAFGMQGTGGSSAIANSFEQYRQAGAAARAVLLAAAAKEWGVPVAELDTEPGAVVHAGSNRRAGYGTLVGVAATMPAPADVPLKSPADFRLIGKAGVGRVDARAKSMGTATFTQDVQLPGLLTAVVAHPPRFGATVKSVDDAKARQVAGVVDVVRIPTGVAVLGENFWAARQGRDALVVEWDESGANGRSTADVFTEFRELAGKPGLEVRKDGDAEAALAGAAKSVEVTYEVPFLAHASMEPLNCVVNITPGGAEVYNGEQMHTLDQQAVAQALGLEPAKVVLHTLYAGGSFGRRAAKTADYMVEAANIAKAIGGRAPVKLVWTREDDTRAGYFRPAFHHRMRGGLDGQGKMVAWWHRAVGPSVYANSAFATGDGKDPAGTEGAADHPYKVPNVYVDQHSPDVGVSVQWWRSVGHSHTAFAVEVFVDEMARAAGRDPVEFRRSMLADDPARLAVLDLAAEKAGWGTPLPRGRARGIAVHKSFNTTVAEVAEVSLVDGKPKVHRVVCAVDCGTVVNPDVVAMQMESGIAFGLGAALYGAINLEGGRVVEANFDRYRMLRLPDMPVVEVHTVPSTAAPTGVGEPGLPPIAPAVANALAALTGKPVRRLPLVG